MKKSKKTKKSNSWKIKQHRDTFFKNNPTSFGIVDDAEVPIGPSMVDFASAVAAENPIDSLVVRTKGATMGLANRITNAPELIQEKAGKLVEELTTDKLDLTIVESQVIKKMLIQLSKEGLKGKISRAQGIEVKNKALTTKNTFTIKDTEEF